MFFKASNYDRLLEFKEQTKWLCTFIRCDKLETKIKGRAEELDSVYRVTSIMRNDMFFKQLELYEEENTLESKK